MKGPAPDFVFEDGFDREVAGAMGASPERWVLGFDAGCGTCRAISSVVEQASDGGLEVLSLDREDMTGWRRQAFGETAPWKPTLLVIGPEATVRGWTGPGMALLLLRRLGIRRSARVLHALGSLKRRADGRASELPPLSSATGNRTRGAVDRAQFLRYVAGTAVAAGMVVTGRTPSFAAAERASAQDWVNANMASLPRAYDQVAAYPMTYRKAIYRALAPGDRSRLWAEQLNRYLTAHPDLPQHRSQVVRDVLAFVTHEASFEVADGRSRDLGRVEELSRAAEQAFERSEIGELFGTLGTHGRLSSSRPVVPDATVYGCDCSTQSNMCSGSSNCVGNAYCMCGVYCCDCGFLWHYECNGVCGCTIA